MFGSVSFSILTLLCLTSCIGSSSSIQKVPLERRIIDTEQQTSSIVSLKIEDTRDQIISHFDKSPFGKFGRLLVYSRKTGDVPNDFVLDTYSSLNKELKDYLALPVTQRQDDVYLKNLDDTYWSSEYFSKGEPVKFQCAFLIHLEPQGDGKTKIEVLEHQPIVNLGKAYMFGRHGWDYYYDIRPVEPTVSDRAELLKQILALLAGK